VPTYRWYSSRPDWLGPKFLAGSPLSSYFFLVDTVLLLVASCLNVFVLVNYWGRTATFTHFWLIVNFAAMITFWVKVWQHHKRIRQLFRTGAITTVEPGSPLDSVMHTAGSLMHLSLYYLYFFLAGLLNLIANILHGRG
jgi:hypothetical protein